MNNEMKRRAFIGTSIAALMGFPFVLRSITGGRRELPKGDYQTNLERCRRLTSITTESTDGPEVFHWKISPPNTEIRYISYLESTCIPFTKTWNGELPDVFYLSEGSINTFLTQEEEMIISGRDCRRTEFWPFEKITHPEQEFMIWIKNGKLVQVSNTHDKQKKYLEKSFVRLLAMNELFPEVTIGTTVKKGVGRLLPFNGRETIYTACGYEMVDQHKTIRFKFKTKSCDYFDMLARKASGKSDDRMVTTRFEKGDAWFDIETGLLVLQQMKIGLYLDNYSEFEKTKEFIANSIITLS